MSAFRVTGIDHLERQVADLDAARREWERLGFTVGPHAARLDAPGQADHRILFPNGAFSLASGGVPGALMLALAVAAFPAGIEGWPRVLPRQLELPEASFVERVTMLDLRPALSPGFTFALSEPPSAAMPIHPVWRNHPNGARALRGATIVVPETAALHEPYEMLFGLGNVHATDHILTLRIGAQRLHLAARDDFTTLYPEVDPAALSPGAALLSIAVADVEATADYLAGQQVAFEMSGAGRLVVADSDAAFLEFVTSVA